MTRRILLAGATGSLGRHVARELRLRGHTVRALSRAPGRLAGEVDEAVRGDLADPASLVGACRGVDVVVSCAGASMRMDTLGDRTSFDAVDHHGSLNLLERARAEGVEKLVYVSLYGADRLARTRYAAAHERFVAALAGSGVRHTVVRPTGFFSFLDPFVEMARRGRGVVIGAGTARTNPVHEADVAEACADAVESGEREMGVGGPDTFTRREIVELAFRAVGRPPRITRVPGWTFGAAAALARPLNPRISALLEFGAAVSQVDVVAPTRGTRRLRDHFAEVAARLA